jgi:hypothetical protein
MQAKMDETLRVAHLQMIQGVITRMGSNSFSLKTASTTLVAGLLAYYGAVPSASQMVAVGGAIVIAVFWLLDANYLRLERLFRALYNKVRAATTMDAADLYSMDIAPFEETVVPIWRIAISWSVLWAYLVGLALVAVVAVTRPPPGKEASPSPPAASNNVVPK